MNCNCYKAPFLVLVIALLSAFVYFCLRDGQLPEIPDQYWGSKSSQALKEDISVKPFAINISEKVLRDLKTRLRLEVSTLEERVTDTLEGVGFEYGMNKKYLKKVTSYWLNKYDWRKREKVLNKYPSFKTKISGIDIHFQHVKGTKKYRGGTRPILLLHGWPGSFAEYHQIIPMLVDPKDSDVNFELVIASLPGFGFSDAPKRSGLGSVEVGKLLLQLMKRLGYEQFYVQGGDWGSTIASQMGTLYKDNVLGICLTMCNSIHPRVIAKYGVAMMFPYLLLDKEEQAQHLPFSKFITTLIRESGHFHVHGTKPDTLGIAFENSPSGWASYVLEKYASWNNYNLVAKEDGGLSAHFKLDDLIDNIMIYWVSNSITSSMRFYRESLTLSYTSSSNLFDVERVSTSVPVSCLNIPREPIALPKFALAAKYPNLVRYTHAKKGGHFNALEIPDVVAQDIIASINLMEVEARKGNYQSRV